MKTGEVKKGNSTLGSLFWKFGEQISAQLVSTIVAVILARILSPDDYGIIAIVTILITICNAFVVGGLGNSLIQKKDADELDFSSIFFVSVFFSFILYLIVFICAVPIAAYYKNADLIWITRIMAIRLPFAAANSVQQAYVSRKMQFKKFFIATLFGTVISAVVGISMAVSGYGAWALVAQYLTNVIIDTIVLFFVGGWFPKFIFSWDRVKKLLPFGMKLMGATLIDTIFNEIRSFIISSKYTPVDLAMYENGRKYPYLLVTNINSSICSVMFPVMAKEQTNRETLKATMKRSIEVSSFILAPLLLGFLACANRFVDVVITSKWAECVPYIWMFCFMCLFYPMHSINIQALNAIGESGKTLKLEIIKKTLNVVVLIPTIFMGVYWIALGATVVSLISTYINAAYSKRMFNYSFFEQMKDIIGILFLGIVMSFGVLMFDRLNIINGVVMLFLDVLLGAVIYVSGSFLFKIPALYILLEKIKPLIRK